MSFKNSDVEQSYWKRLTDVEMRELAATPEKITLLQFSHRKIDPNGFFILIKQFDNMDLTRNLLFEPLMNGLGQIDLSASELIALAERINRVRLQRESEKNEATRKLEEKRLSQSDKATIE